MPRSRQGQSISISTSTLLKIGLLVLGAWLIWMLADIIAIVVAAILLAALIEPFANWLHERHMPRGIAVFSVYVVLAGLTALVIILLVPVVLEQSVQLFPQLSAAYGGITESLGRFQNLAAEFGFAENVSMSLESIQGLIQDWIENVFSTVAEVIWFFAGLVTVLVLAFYMVIEEDAAKKFFRTFLPEEYQPYFSQRFSKMQKKIGAWLRGQIILGLIIGITVYIGLTLLGVKYALLLALIAGLFEIVPYVGPVMSVIPAAIIGFAQSPLTGVLVVALYLIIQQLENNILVPKVMQKVTGLNPIVSILALLVGIKLGGLVGAVLSIPIATMAAVVLEDLFNDLV